MFAVPLYALGCTSTHVCGKVVGCATLYVDSNIPKWLAVGLWHIMNYVTCETCATAALIVRQYTGYKQSKVNLSEQDNGPS